jgi:heme exporter protein B
MSQLLTLIIRDIRLAFGRGGIWLPVIFFLLVATLYPFGVGPDGPLLARTGGGVLWIAALLASLLPIDRLIAPDAEAGILDQFAVRGISDEWIASARVIAHWLTFGPPLMLAVATIRRYADAA